MNGFATGTPRILLRLEGLLVLVGATFAYASLDARWWLFGLLFFAPDLFMLGYLGGRRVGASIYNLGHCYALPLGLIGAGLVWNAAGAVGIGVIWVAHIGFDRALGYGLKYADGFGSSHLGQVGRSSPAS